MTRHSDREPKGSGRTGGSRPPDPDKAAPRKSSGRAVGEVARVRAIRSDKPRHGQKRRASQKRHEIGMVRELHLHPEESPSEAARSLRERPPAEVIDVREGLRRRELQAQARQESAPPPEEPTGLLERLYEGGRTRVLSGIEKMMNAAVRVVTFTGEMVQTIRELRHREA